MADENKKPRATEAEDGLLNHTQDTLSSMSLDEDKNDKLRQLEAKFASMESEKRLLEMELKLSKMETEKEKVEKEKAELKAQVEVLKLQREMEANGGGGGGGQPGRKAAEAEMDSSELGQLYERFQSMMADHLLQELVEEEGKLKEFMAKKDVCLVRVAGNRWCTDGGGWKVEADGLTATKRELLGTVRSVKPFPLASVGGTDHHRLFYFEIRIKHFDKWICIGLSGVDFPLAGELVGQFPGSYSIDEDGDFGYGKKGTWKGGAGGRHANGDVVGCGLLAPEKGGRFIFFTKNGKPILLKSVDVKGDLFPTVTAASMSANDAVEANFGADPEGNPFKFDLACLRVIDG